MRTWMKTGLLALLFGACAAAQPSVGADLSVTFRLRAPEAKQVIFASEASY